jgi:hypothetical protein
MITITCGVEGTGGAALWITMVGRGVDRTGLAVGVVCAAVLRGVLVVGLPIRGSDHTEALSDELF